VGGAVFIGLLNIVYQKMALPAIVFSKLVQIICSSVHVLGYENFNQGVYFVQHNYSKPQTARGQQIDTGTPKGVERQPPFIFRSVFPFSLGTPAQ
jgi:hypothetical protein